MKTKPIVLIDCDEVLCNFVGGVLKAHEKITSTKLTVDGLKYPGMTWDIFNHPLIAPYKQELVKVICEEGFCAALEPYKDSIHGMASLRSVASQVFVVTSPWFTSRHWVTERNRWLYDHFGIVNKEIIHTSAKHLIKGDVFIDDRLSHLESWIDNNNGLAVLWATDFNSGDHRKWISPNTPHNQYRAITNHWPTLVEIVADVKPVLRLRVQGLRWGFSSIQRCMM